VFKAHRWLYHSTLGSREIKKRRSKASLHYSTGRVSVRDTGSPCRGEAPLLDVPAMQGGREFFNVNLLVRIHFIIVMIRWTGLAPWEFEFPFPGTLASTFLGQG